MSAPRLKTSADVRRFVSKLIAAAHSGDLPIAKASRLTWMANVLHGMLASSAVDERLTAIEQKLQASR